MMRARVGLALVLAAGFGPWAHAADGALGAADLSAGKALFTQGATPACAVCHTLKHAGSTGEIGPVLDEIKPTAERVATALRNGVGLMPAYKGQLSDAQIQLLARYVAGTAGR